MDKRQDDLKRAEHICHEWDKALLALYADDAVIESPLIPHLLNTEKGICKGKQEIRKLIEIVITRKPPVRKYYRKGFSPMGQRSCGSILDQLLKEIRWTLSRLWKYKRD